jgi:hypothetical protein
MQMSERIDILVLKDKKGGTARLTTDSPMSHYGAPVLRIEAEDIDGDFGPSDLLGNLPNIHTAGGVVMGWLSQTGRTRQEIEAGRKFLMQSPDPEVQLFLKRLSCGG